MTRPFEGIRVIDVTHVLAGPFAAYQLAVLGADVIKVERSRTTPTRAARPAPTRRSTAANMGTALPHPGLQQALDRARPEDASATARS